MIKNLKRNFFINNMLPLVILLKNMYAMEKPILEKPPEALLKVIVSTSKMANVHLLLEPNANILDLKEKVSFYDQIDIKNSRVYLVKTTLGILQKRSGAIADIQKLKDVINLHKTNTFLVCSAKK